MSKSDGACRNHSAVNVLDKLLESVIEIKNILQLKLFVSLIVLSFGGDG
jgi:hypothetical protein